MYHEPGGQEETVFLELRIGRETVVKKRFACKTGEGQ
mgnify:FL=1